MNKLIKGVMIVSTLLFSANILSNSKNKNTSLLNLSGKKLNDIQNIKTFASRAITAIDLSNNNFSSLDLKQLCDYFPNLKKLDVSNNKLKSLKIGTLPDCFIINASNNELTDLEAFEVGEGCKLDFSGNRFSYEVQEKIKMFVKSRKLKQHARVLFRYPDLRIWHGTYFLSVMFKRVWVQQ